MSGPTVESSPQSGPSEDPQKPEDKEISHKQRIEQNRPHGGAQENLTSSSDEVRGGKLVLINASLCLCTLLVGLVSLRLRTSNDPNHQPD